MQNEEFVAVVLGDLRVMDVVLEVAAVMNPSLRWDERSEGWVACDYWELEVFIV